MYNPLQGTPPYIIGLMVLSLVSTFWAVHQFATHRLAARAEKKRKQALALAEAQRNYDLSLKGRISELEEQVQILLDENKRLTYRNRLMSNEIRSDEKHKTTVYRPSSPGRDFNS